MPYRLTEEAARDLVELTAHGLEQFGEVQTRKYLSGLFNTFELLSDMSGVGRKVPELGNDLQRFEHGRHSIFYIARAGHVEIGRIIDNRRDMSRQFQLGDAE